MTRARLLLAIALLAVGCTRKEPRPAGAPADSTALSATPQPGDNPVITDSAAIFSAHGLSSGPFWTLEVFAEGIRFRWAENRTGVVFPAGRVDGGDSSSTWVAKRWSSTPPHAISMQLLRLNCTDGTTDTVYAYRVALMIDARDQRLGCAKSGPGGQPPRR